MFFLFFYIVLVLGIVFFPPGVVVQVFSTVLADVSKGS